ncbi:WD_0033/WD_0034 family tandem repeat-containing protein [Wolbachia endosymbiont of Bemisia tabaci]|uniref:WD_0033/WD_0034 family tandem repeat-containing protein n=1 Tax=Wolbachia endosymbiont of Bemisia tabaci TaxID=215173 RepID=UPI000D5506F3|nr:magnesium transporter [Wolbachia endosymbiont of Bemisia tabaci]
MPKYEELSKAQKRLYDKLKIAILREEDISCAIYKGVPVEEDWKKILTTVKCINYDDQEHTLTLLGYAINHENIQGILGVAKEKGILEEVLTTANIKIRLSCDQENTLTPLAYAIILYNQEVIKNILDVAKKNNMLEKVFASIKKDHLNKTKNILEILKNQEQDEEQKAKIDGWLKILAKSISSCETNKIEMHDRVEEICKKQEQEDWKVTLEKVVPNHENKDKCEIFSEIFNEETFKVSLDPQRNADMITLIRKNQPDYESKEQSLVDESSIPKTEGNITDESSTSEIESSKQKDKVKTTNKPIIIGCVYGAIAALATGGGCFAAGVALPILALIGIAIAAALVTGLVAGGITYVISKPSENLDRANVEQRVSIGLTA